MNKKQLENYTDVLLGKARIIHAKTKPTPAERFADKLIARSRRDHAKMTASQHRAAICRGC
jgi:hypothetical protein